MLATRERECIFIPLKIAKRKHYKNADEGVVLAVIQITDDQVSNGRHLHVQNTYGVDDVSSFLIQQGEGEVEEDGSSSSTTAWW